MIREIIIVSVLITLIDLLFLKYILMPLFGKMVQEIQLSEMKPNMTYIFVPYILMIISIVVFVLPLVKSESIGKDSILYGGLLGLIIFGIYEFTNMVIFKNYKFHIAVFDTIWGIVLYSIVTFLTKTIILYLKDLI